MKPTTIIVLAVVLGACLAAALLSSDLFAPEKTDDTDEGPAALFDPAPGRILGVKIVGQDQTLVLARQGEKWRLVEPVDAAADAFSVNQIVDTVKDIKASEARDVDDETTGLGSPRWTVTLTDDKGAEHTLLVGAPRPLQPQQTYVRPGGSKASYIAAVDLADRLAQSAGDLRDMTVLDVQADKIERVKITGPESIELIRREGKWQLASPVAAPADDEAARKVVDALAQLTATAFVADEPGDLGPFGLATPRVLAELHMAPERPATTATSEPNQPPARPGKVYRLALGKKIDDEVYARLADSPSVFRVRQSLFDSLQPKPVSLRARTILDINADAVTGVDIDGQAGKAGLVKVEGEWRMAMPRSGPASKDAMDRLLTDAAALKAESFRDDTDNLALYGLDKPRAEVTFRMAGTGASATLLVGKASPSGEMTFVKSAGADSVAVVKTGDLSAILSEPATYWDETILELPADTRVASMELRRTDDTYSLVHDANGQWRLTAPLTSKANEDQINKILDSLESLRAEKVVFVGETVPVAYAKSEDVMQVVLTTTTPPDKAAATAPATAPATGPVTDPNAPVVQTRTLTVTKIGLHSYAWQGGARPTVVGQFPLTLYNDLSGELRGRGFWSINPAGIQQVRILTESDTLELKRDGSSWTYTKDPYVKLDAEKVKAFLDECAKIEADKFVTNRKPKDLKQYGLDKPWLVLELTDEAGHRTTLWVSYTGITKDKDRYAMTSAGAGVMSLPASAMATLARTLKDFRQ